MRTSCPAFCSPSGKRTLVGGDSSRLKGARAKGRPPEVAAARGRLRWCRPRTSPPHRLRRVDLHPPPRPAQRPLTPCFSTLLEPGLNPREQVVTRRELDAVDPLIERQLNDPVDGEPARKGKAEAGARVHEGGRPGGRVA